MSPMANQRSKPQRGCIYTRISLAAEGDNLAIERQQELCEKRAKEEGWTVVRVFTDPNISASSFTTKTRPQYEEMMEGLRSGTYDGVVSYNTDRISRKLRDLLELADLAKADKVQVLTCSTGLLDLTSAPGRMHLEVLGSFSAMESAIKSERHLAANDQRYGAGKHYGRTVPFGYARGAEGIEIDPVTEPFLREGFKRIKAGETCSDVANYWDSEGVLTKFGKRWASESVYQVVTSPVYAGILERKGVEQNVKTTWEPYLTREDHELVKAALKRGNRTTGGTRAPRGKFALSGVLICSCGLHMTGRTDRDRKVYQCSGRSRRTCYRTMRVAEAEETVRTYVIARLNMLTPETVLAPEVVKRQKEIAESLMTLTAESEEIENNMRIPRKKRIKYSEEAETEREDLLRELRELTKASLLGSIVAHVLEWEREDAHLREQGQSARQLATAYDALEQSQKMELMRFLGEYRVKAHGTTIPSTVQILPRDLETGIADPSEWWEEHLEMLGILERSTVTYQGEVIDYSLTGE